eukprot:TRINITY_DN3690_c0_g1_i1.p1 TRINITY_DN3690_c0_g1~~TRINITY_DN3690_c0_g1_i1.p1  ORF type:complete len:171 (+),score=7.54 TRINITY_DN3690_c0_g1_i1:33-515(+)
MTCSSIKTFSIKRIQNQIRPKVCRQSVIVSCCKDLSRRHLSGFVATTLLTYPLLPSFVGAQVCDAGAEGQECRQSNLSKDADKLNSSRLEAQSKRNEKITTASGGIPVPVLDDEYSRVTLSLADVRSQYQSKCRKSPSNLGTVGVAPAVFAIRIRRPAHG